uniref:NADH dehydrogenase subunit 4L n=1 Tax=Zaptyx minuta TaxID=3248438 RepID=A0A224AAV0_9EUPU|nr:NADH dehydrogenase subunit 4L [Hemiphaedusa minuta]
MMLAYTLAVLMVLLFIRFFNMQKHFLSALLLLESMVVIMLMSVLALMLLLNDTKVAWFLLVTFAVAEAALGLSMLISYIKINKNDYIKTM